MSKGCHVLTIFCKCEGIEEAGASHRVVSGETFKKVKRILSTNERAPVTRKELIKASLARLTSIGVRR